MENQELRDKIIKNLKKQHIQTKGKFLFINKKNYFYLWGMNSKAYLAYLIKQYISTLNFDFKRVD